MKRRDCTITVDFPDGKVELFQACTIEKPSEATFKQNDLKIAEVFLNASNRIVDVCAGKSCRGCLFYYEGDLEDMATVARILSRKDAAGLIVIRDPLQELPLPVFVLESGIQGIDAQPSFPNTKSNGKASIYFADPNEEPKELQPTPSEEEHKSENAEPVLMHALEDADQVREPDAVVDTKPKNGDVQRDIQTSEMDSSNVTEAHPRSDDSSRDPNESIFVCQLTVDLGSGKEKTFQASSTVFPDFEKRGFREVQVFRKADKIHQIIDPEKLSDYVVSFASTEQRDVDDLVKLLSMKKVSAVLVKHPPSTAPEFPVFVSNLWTKKDLKNGTKINVNVVGIVESNQKRSLSWAPTFAGESHAKEGRDESGTSQKKGFLSPMDAVRNAVGGMMNTVFRIPDKWHKVLRDSPGWNAEKKYARYDEAMHRLEKSDTIMEQTEINEELFLFLNQATYTISHLSFAARVFLKWGSYQVGRQVLNELRDRFSADCNFVKSIKTFPKKYVSRHPHTIFSDFLIEAVRRWEEMKPIPCDDEGLLICILSMWYKMGLLANYRERQQEILQLQLIIGDFFGSGVGRLESPVGRVQARTVGVLLSLDISSALHVMRTTAQQSMIRRLTVDKTVSGWLLYQLEKETEMVSGDMISFRRMCRDLYLFLITVQFRTSAWRADDEDEVLRKLIDASTFGRQNTLNFYSTLLEELKVEYLFRDKVRRLVRDRVGDDLLYRSVKREQFLDFFGSQTARAVLSFDNITEAISACAQRIARNETSFKRNLCFAGALYIQVSHSSISTRSIQIVCDLVKASIQGIPNRESLWFETIDAAREDPDIFSSPNGIAVQTVTNLVFSDCDGRRLMKQPRVVAALLNPEGVSEAGAMYKSVCGRIGQLLRNAPANIGEASQLLLDLSSTPWALSVAEKSFHDAFSKWNVSSIEQIVKEGEFVLEAMYRCFDIDSTGLAGSAERLLNLGVGWLEAFNTDAVTIDDLRRAHRLCRLDSWRCFGSKINLNLPTDDDIGRKLNRFNPLVNEIIQCISGPDANSISVILKGYNCVPSDSSPVGKLLLKYADLVDKDNQDARDVAQELKELQEDCNQAKRFRKQYEKTFKVCHYFLEKKSTYFEKLMTPFTKKISELESLAVAIDQVLIEIGEVFGPSTTFEKVDSAVKTMSSSRLNTLDSELHILTGCELLALSESDRNRFKAVALMSRFSEPLERFCQFCHQFKFAIVSSTDFNDLKSLSETVSSGKILEYDAQACVAFSERLCSILCPRAAALPAAQRYSDMEQRLPCLGFLAALSIHGELWSFAREMRWLNKDGLKRFHDEHGNATNILLGNSASYEMSVLDALEPTIRAISYVATLQNETNVSNLLDSLGKSNDVRRCAKSGYDEIEQVHSNLSLVREWFTNGLDEISAIYCEFEAVSKSGNYGIATSCDDTPVLCLVYHHDGKKCTKRTEDLSRFVQYVSLIQHEDESIAKRVDCFVEQYHIINKAFSINLSIVSLGFEANFDSFSCGVGSDHIAYSRELLRESEEGEQRCKSRRHELQKIYPVSLLFSTEELRDIFNSEWQRRDSSSWLGLTNTTSRLLATPERLNSRSRVDTIKSVVSSTRCFSGTSGGWLQNVSAFLEKLHSEFGKEAIQWGDEAAKRGGESTSEITIHTLAVDDASMNSALYKLLRLIYRNHLPRNFEILDAENTTLDLLDIFLKRTKCFNRNTFTVMNTSGLPGRLVEKLRSFLSSRCTSRGFHLHLIQRESSMLPSCPWIETVTWDCQKLELELLQAGCGSEVWMGRAVDQTFIKAINVVWTPSCGTGKTRFIHEELRKAQSRSDSMETATITIHENSTVISLIDDLNKKFSSATGKRGVHFNFCCLPDRCSNRSWLESINKFFFSLLILRSVNDPSSGCSFYLGEQEWVVFIEFPGSNMKISDWLQCNIPVLLSCGAEVTPPNSYHIDHRARRVCTYLRAFRDGSINRKFESRQRQIMFVLDWSGSMTGDWHGNTPLNAATDNALRLFDSHVRKGDCFGVTMFDHLVHVAIPVQRVQSENHKMALRQILDGVRNGGGGGTSMHSALLTTLNAMECSAEDRDTWLICLTDGVSDKKHYNELREYLTQSPERLCLVVIGIGLQSTYEGEMRQLCGKYRGCERGFFVPSASSTAALDVAFNKVASRIPVSETFELLDGIVSDSECRKLIHSYKPSSIRANDFLLQSFWIRFLYRRVKFFDSNSDFNENVKHERLGSTLMGTMLEEVSRLLEENHSRDWVGENHAQLIYDFSEEKNPKFRLICTSPQDLGAELRCKYESLDLPGFVIPKKNELERRETLDKFLSQALSVPLHHHAEGGGYHLKCVDDHGFILTLDFTMKLLNIHERVACQVPCIIEGETGVSKTALTKMYAHIRNSALKSEAQTSTEKDLMCIENQLLSQGIPRGCGDTPLVRLRNVLVQAAQKSIGDATEVAESIHKHLLEKLKDRSDLFQDAPLHIVTPAEARTDVVLEFVDWFARAIIEQTFFEFNIDASLTEDDVVGRFHDIRTVARKVRKAGALVVVFLDEVNTTSVMGIFKEIVSDNMLMGEKLEENLVVVAACNPYRIQATTKGENLYENDLGKDWASGHYQVVPLPLSMSKLKWAFGSLSHKQEKEFVFRRIEKIQAMTVSASLHASMTEVVVASHEAMRKFAAKHIKEGLKRLSGVDNSPSGDGDFECEAAARAKSVVSLRDIQRVFSFYEFFSSDTFPLMLRNSPEDTMMLSVAVVYFLRLDSESRLEFRQHISSLACARDSTDLQSILDIAMNKIACETAIPQGIALTRGLKENIFMTLVCLLSRTPLLIVGPPGSSKTLAVNIASDNANGEDSPSAFYRDLQRLTVFHYQCSKDSTSKEIGAVFDKAIQRQEKSDPTKNLSFVFMDEAGLPEEEKESLKVLHYLLEGHMSAKAKVGFVAISNHVLDAAKSNRCVMLLRQEPDNEEMTSITSGVLLGRYDRANTLIEEVVVDGESTCVKVFVEALCSSYRKLQHEEFFERFFGMRDYIYFLKALRCLASMEVSKMMISMGSIVKAIERNFNGLHHDRLQQIASLFLKEVTGKRRSQLVKVLLNSLSEPLEVIRSALTSPGDVVDINTMSTRPRYKLIIDKTDDDSIMRLLNSVGILDVGRQTLLQLSALPEERDVEQARLISRVKYSALQGKHVVLSQTEPVNEAMYDLLNQRFHVVGKRLYANIAVEGVSRRCLVKPSFECMVHIRHSQLDVLPAPFLNRFEKYVLGIGDVLYSGWARLGNIAAFLKAAKDQTRRIIGVLSKDAGLFGWVQDEDDSLNSVFIDFLPIGALCSPKKTKDSSGVQPSSFEEHLTVFVSTITSISVKHDDVSDVIEMAGKSLPMELKEILKEAKAERQLDSSLVLESMYSLMKPNKETTRFTKLCGVLLQMLVTKAAVSRLIQVATPEALFLHCAKLPTDVISEYFGQDHFCLKGLLSTVQHNQSQKLMLYVRSDASIHGLPSVSASFAASALAGESLKVLKELVYDNPEELVMDHLSNLRSETVLRACVETWLTNEKKRIFILLVDMSTKHAASCTNFVRSLVERSIDDTMTKTFVLLLHFPPSVASLHNCYPALFLGGWQHHFLDGIGEQHRGSLGVDAIIKVACQKGHVGEYLEFSDKLSDSLKTTFPVVLKHVSSNVLLADEQMIIDSSYEKLSSFSERYRFLMRHLDTAIDDETIGSIIASKFAATWLTESLDTTMKRACEGLWNGRTRLPLSQSIRSSLSDSFQVYVLALINRMNEGSNLDIVSSALEGDATMVLFAMILRGFPMPPLKELLLSRATPFLPEKRLSKVHFPFFNFISTSIEELIELALQETTTIDDRDAAVADNVTRKVDQVWEYIESFLHSTKSNLKPSGGKYLFEKRVTIRATIDFVMDQNASNGALFLRYVEDFTSWKTMCSQPEVAVDWIRGKLRQFQQDRNIVMVHLLVRILEKEFMSVSSWTNLNSSLGKRKRLPSGQDFVEGLICKFENPLRNEKEKKLWCSSFQRFLRQMKLLLQGDSMSDSQLSRVRILCFVYILRSSQVPICALDKWRSSISTDGDQYSGDLAKLLKPLKNDVAASCKRAIRSAFRFYFSRLWISITPSFQTQDFSCLLDFLVSESTPFGPFGPSILRQACSSFVSVAHDGFMSIDLLPTTPFVEISRRLQTHRIDFQSSSSGHSLPHFIPAWLRTNQCADEDSNRQEKDLVGVYFNNFRSCVDDVLGDSLFSMLVELCVRDAEANASEQLLIIFLREVESEVGMGNGDSPCGRIVSGMLLDARLLCLVTRVAYELATHGVSSALSGAYNGIAHAIFEHTFSLPNCRYDDLFFHTIIRVRGEGTMSSLLSKDGALHNVTWCRAWVEGGPEIADEARNALRQAEKDLADGISEENRKAREFLLCPHCGNEFIVAARNCGQFRCGSDAHGGIAGAQVLNVHGCGRDFQVDTARPYVPNEAILGPLRARVEDIRSVLGRCETSAGLWEQAKTMVVPVFAFSLENEGDAKVFATSSISDQPHVDGFAAIPLLRRFFDGDDFVIQQKVLPDLVEVYLWIHTTFRYLVSKEEAFSLKMKDVVDEDKLRGRFGEEHTKHVVSLWERTALSLNQLLESMEYKVYWQCEEIQIPFKTVEDAPLISFVSEGAHPTDGNDFLFLIINSIIETYNRFVRWFSDFEVEGDFTFNSGNAIHPKFIVGGSFGAVALKTVVVLSRAELNDLIRSCWNGNSYDLDLLDDTLRQELSLHLKRPIIMNPIDHLRSQFFFRAVESSGLNTARAQETGIWLGRNGSFYANAQDVQLYDSVCALLSSDLRGNCQIRWTLEDKLHNLDYNGLRATLDGIRNILQMLAAEEIKGLSSMHDMLCSIFQLSHDRLLSKQRFVMDELGFPALNDSQMELMLSLSPNELTELVHFVGFQLASEAYHFAGRGVSVKEVMVDEHANELETSFQKLVVSEGVETTLQYLDEFARDILSFYENLICDEALVASESSLRSFLLKNNCCDSDDPVLTVIPVGLTLRHYVSLRSKLHQLKLATLFNQAAPEKEASDEVVEKMKEEDGDNGCWLYNAAGADLDASDAPFEHAPWRKHNAHDLLWFTKGLDMTVEKDETMDCLSNASVDRMSVTNEGDGLDSVMDEETAILAIQRWWRRFSSYTSHDDESEMIELEDYLVMDDAPSSFEEEGRNEESLMGRQIVQSSDVSGDESNSRHHVQSEGAVLNQRDDALEEIPNSTISPKSTDSSQSEMEWTYDNIYVSDKSSSGRLYGDLKDQREMRKWLDQLRLPQEVGDELVRLGASDVSDVVMLVTEAEAVLKERLPMLHMMKLKKGVRAHNAISDT